jgi:hypothetical protein
MADVPKHPQAKLWPSELVTLGVLFALKGRGERAFWLAANYRHLFPCLPDRTRLFRALSARQLWTRRFLANPTLLGIADSFGIELIHPRREGRSKKQIGKKGISNGRWILGVKFCPVINSQGLIVTFDAAPANVPDGEFQRLLRGFDSGEQGMGIYVDSGFHRADSRGGDAQNLKVCQRGECNLRMLVETLFSQLSGTMALKKVAHRRWMRLEMRLSFVSAAYNLLVAWGGALATDEEGKIRLSVAQFVL